MARIRTIKPEFPQSESVGRLSRDARLLFLQLFTIVDDAGRARAASRMLASLLYPYDNDAPGLIDAWLSELERDAHVRRYVVDGSTYLEISNWLKHQKIDKPSASRLPAFVDGSRSLAKPREEATTDLVSGPSTLDLGPSINSAAPAAAKTNVVNVAIADVVFETFWSTYPKRDGANPREPARKRFKAAVKAGADPESIILAARRYADEMRQKGQFGTPYVAQAQTWLGQQRWFDYAPAAENPTTKLANDKLAAKHGYRWDEAAGKYVQIGDKVA